MVARQPEGANQNGYGPRQHSVDPRPPPHGCFRQCQTEGLCGHRVLGVPSRNPGGRQAITKSFLVLRLVSERRSTSVRADHSIPEQRFHRLLLPVRPCPFRRGLLTAPSMPHVACLLCSATAVRMLVCEKAAPYKYKVVLGRFCGESMGGLREGLGFVSRNEFT